MESSEGNLYRIVKTYNEDPQPYKSPNQEFISLIRIADEIECDFYETNQIEYIGKSPDDRLILIDKKSKKNYMNYLKILKNLQIDLDANAQEYKNIKF